MLLKRYQFLILSCILHSSILLALILGFDFSTPIPVIEQGHENSIINAVVLGDTPKSKVIRETTSSPPIAPKLIAKPASLPKVKNMPDKIPIPKKNQNLNFKLDDKKRRDLLAKDLLEELEKQNKKKNLLAEKNKKQLKELKEKTEQTLRQQILDKEVKLKSQLAIKARGEINKYKALILQSISEHWIIPTGVNKKLSCDLLIRLAPNGAVLTVQVTKSSGDPALDSSARSAVLKASPLPVPKDETAFKPFKSFILKVKPENILANQ